MFRSKTTSVVLALCIAIAATGAWADEATGKVQKLDRDQKMIVLEDGTELWATDNISLDALREGSTVKVAYDDKDGKKWLTSVEVIP